MTEGLWKDVSADFDAVLARLPAALAAEGFGVVTQIDLKQTFRDKLGREFKRYRILGACNPSLAFEAVQLDPRIGVRLPCNVVVYEREDGGATVGAIDPLATLGEHDARFAALAREVGARLQRVVDAVA